MTSTRKFIVSARQMPTRGDPAAWIRNKFGWAAGEVESVFGFAVEFSPLYGGRKCLPRRNVTSQHQVEQLKQAGIDFELCLSSDFFVKEAYQASLPLLEKMAVPGNCVITVNDELARQVKKDFPAYTLRASGIKRICTERQVDEAFEIYDSITLPPWIIRKPDFLRSLPEKDRFVVFGIIGCGFSCMEKDEDRCYRRASLYNLAGGVDPGGVLPCLSRKHPASNPRLVYRELDLDDPVFEGFTRFRLIQSTRPRVDGGPPPGARDGIFRELGRKRPGRGGRKRPGRGGPGRGRGRRRGAARRRGPALG